ncbi:MULTISPECIES: hypothetical protein [Paraburkholderia]
MSLNVSGTEGYAEMAESLIEHWQEISFKEQHAPVMSHFKAARLYP